MRKKVVTGICILLAIVLLIPIPMRLKDGGTVVYNAILYQVENVHRIDPEATSENDYLEGMIVKILGIEVYNNVYKIIYVFLTIFLYLLKCPQSLILSALRAFCFCGKPHISRSIFLYFRYQTWLKSW